MELQVISTLKIASHKIKGKKQDTETRGCKCQFHASVGLKLKETSDGADCRLSYKVVAGILKDTDTDRYIPTPPPPPSLSLSLSFQS